VEIRYEEMKNIILFLALIFSAFTLDAQKYIQTFTKSDGGEIALSLETIAFVSPSGTLGGSVLMTGPTPKAVYVTDTLANIVSGSAAMLVELTEIRAAGNRQVAVSKQHVQEIIPSGASQTLLKLKNPVISVLVTGAFSVIADSLAAESGGGGTADGNGIYSSSDTVPEGTLATILPGSGDVVEFAIGDFPSWPDINGDGTEYGFYYSPEYWGGTGFFFGNSSLNVGNSIEANGQFFIGRSENPNNSSETQSLILGQKNAYIVQKNLSNSNDYGFYVETSKYNKPTSWLSLGRPAIASVIADNPDTSMCFRITFSPTSVSSNTQDVLNIKLSDTTLNSISLYGYKYKLPNALPSQTASNKSVMTWTGAGGTSTTPAFTRFSNNIATATTDGSGDLTITHLLPDATFSVTVTAEGTTPYICTVHTKGATTFKVRISDAAGVAVTATEVTVNWIAYDY